MYTGSPLSGLISENKPMRIVIKTETTSMPAKLSLYALSDVNKRKTNLPIFKPTSMAFNLRTLGTRSLSALFFVVLLLGSVTWNYLSFTVFFLVVALGALHEYFNLVQHMGIRAYRVAGFLC